MPKILDAKIGDTVLVEYTVLENKTNGSRFIYAKTKEGTSVSLLADREVHSIVRKPYEPKIGDRVKIAPNGVWIWEIIGMDGDQAWIKKYADGPTGSSSNRMTHNKGELICVD